MIAVAALSALIPTFMVRHFAEMYRAFGTEPSWLTRWVVDYTALFRAIPMIGIVIAWRWPDRTRVTIIALAFSAAALLMVIPLLIFALYLPIFRMGAAIG